MLGWTLYYTAGEETGDGSGKSTTQFTAPVPGIEGRSQIPATDYNRVAEVVQARRSLRQASINRSYDVERR